MTITVSRLSFSIPDPIKRAAASGAGALIGGAIIGGPIGVGAGAGIGSSVDSFVRNPGYFKPVVLQPNAPAPVFAYSTNQGDVNAAQRTDKFVGEATTAAAAVAGAELGAAIGSAVPGVGTVIGGAIGGILAAGMWAAFK